LKEIFHSPERAARESHLAKGQNGKLAHAAGYFNGEILIGVKRYEIVGTLSHYLSEQTGAQDNRARPRRFGADNGPYPG
jgi:hypothetical protein